MKFFIIITLLLSTFASANESSDIQAGIAKEKAEFEQMKQSQMNAFNAYKKALNKEYQSYKDELNKYWKHPELSTKKVWVSYSNDKQSRSTVNFAKENYSVAVIAKNKKDAIQKLAKRIAYVASVNTQEVVKIDALQKNVAKISKEIGGQNTRVDPQPILSELLFKKKPTRKSLQKYVQNVLKEHKLRVNKAKNNKEKVYKIVVQLPKYSKYKRSIVFKDEVAHNSQRFQLPAELLFAIMQTESDFNPFAKSRIPAYGLMQIVPTSAGRDAYRFLYRRKGMPTVTYLYNSKHNIEMGSTYLHILYFSYLRKIKNPISRLYCAIAAYNTGAGNIAWAFTGKYNMTKAAPKINKLTPEEVYEYLLNNLRFDEPKYYLKNVRRRMAIYKKVYNL